MIGMMIIILIDMYTKFKQGVCHTMALPFTLKYLKAKEELWKLEYFMSQPYFGQVWG
jgi:hypothetical protein